MKKKQAVKYFGSQTKVANALNISRAAVSKWPEIVPIKRAHRLVQLSGGKLRLVLTDYTL